MKEVILLCPEWRAAVPLCCNALVSRSRSGRGQSGEYQGPIYKCFYMTVCITLTHTHTHTHTGDAHTGEHTQAFALARNVQQSSAGHT